MSLGYVILSKSIPWAMPPSLLFHALFLSPQSCFYNLLEGQPGNSWPLGGKYCIIANPSRYSGLHLPCFLQHVQYQHFSVNLLEVGDRHTMTVRSPSVGAIPSRAIGLLGIVFATLGVSPAGPLGLNPDHPSPKVTYPHIKSPLHFYGISGPLSFINLFLSHLLTPTTRTLTPDRQHCSISLIIKIFLTPLTGPDNPLPCHYCYYYLECIYDNEMFTIGSKLNCSY